MTPNVQEEPLVNALKHEDDHQLAYDEAGRLILPVGCDEEENKTFWRSLEHL